MKIEVRYTCINPACLHAPTQGYPLYTKLTLHSNAAFVLYYFMYRNACIFAT